MLHPPGPHPPRLLYLACLPAAANDDCEVGAAGRKACKNCTCGRAEEGPDAKPAKLTKEMLDNPTSGCGSVSVWVQRLLFGGSVSVCVLPRQEAEDALLSMRHASACCFSSVAACYRGSISTQLPLMR